MASCFLSRKTIGTFDPIILWAELNLENWIPRMALFAAHLFSACGTTFPATNGWKKVLRKRLESNAFKSEKIIWEKFLFYISLKWFLEQPKSQDERIFSSGLRCSNWKAQVESWNVQKSLSQNFNLRSQMRLKSQLENHQPDAVQWRVSTGERACKLQAVICRPINYGGV